MVRKILKWSDKKYEEAMNETNNTKGLGKAFLSGAAEGLVNGCFLGGLIILTANVISIVKNIKK